MNLRVLSCVGALFFTASLVQAQNYSFQPGKVISAVIATVPNYSDYQINIKNLKSTKLGLRVDLLSNTFKSEWDYSVCITGTCFVVMPATAYMDSIPIGGTGFFKLNMSPEDKEGAGEFKVVVYEEANPTIKDTLIIAVNAIQGMGVNTGSLQVAGINVYPNPASDVLHINPATYGVGPLTICDVTGKVIKTIQGHNRVIDVSDLDVGMYLLSNANGTLRQAFSVVRQ
jgi:hypothetical protein